MDMKSFWRAATQHEKEMLANKASASVGYLGQVAGGHRKPSHKLVKRLVEADSRFSYIDLRPDIYCPAQKHNDEAAA